MNLRNVQKTGKMFYVYLPTQWCKKYKISGSSKVDVDQNSDGSLVIYPVKKKREKIKLHMDLSNYKDELSPGVVNKMVVAAYINPVDSFRIDLNRDINMEELIDQKNLLNIEFVDFGKRHISCETPISIEEPYMLLKTMLKKVKSMLYIMVNNYHEPLIQKYEDEVDKSKLLIEKAVIHGLLHGSVTHMRPVELYYTSLLAKEMERFVDHAKEVDVQDKVFLRNLEKFLKNLLVILGMIEEKTMTHTDLADFLQSVDKQHRKRYKEYHKIRIMSSMRLMSETIGDWLITSSL